MVKSLSSDATGSTIARRYPLSFVFSGYYYWDNGQLYYQGASGNWWSTSATASDTARYLGMNATILNPQFNGSKLGGFSLRCVSDKTMILPLEAVPVYIIVSKERIGK